MPRAPDLAGQVLDGRYELRSLIGEGTFGRVYRGFDRRLARTVAVKVIKPWWAEDPAWVRRFELEAKILARLSDPAIVRIYDVGESGASLYYVAELVAGESLAEQLRRGALSASHAAAVAEQLCRALARAHEQGVVHRDVKPANILLTSEGELKVSDFGVARLTEGSSGAPATAIGTPQYMSPEQSRGERTTPASDVYGAAVVLYEMIVGRPPFPGQTPVEIALRHVHEAPPALPAGTPRALGEVVQRALAKEPSARYSDGAEMAEALATARASIPKDNRALASVGAAAASPLPTTATPSLPTASMPTSATKIGGVWPGTAPTRLDPPPPPARPKRRPWRRRLILFGVLAAAGVSVLAFMPSQDAQTTVPHLLGLHRSGVQVRLHRHHLHASLSTRYAAATSGTVIGQDPRAGSRVGSGTTVAVLLSAGPPPVAVPALTGRSAADARARLHAVGLLASTTSVPAPGVPAGTVFRQRPSPPATAARGSTIALILAQAPRWRTATTFAGVSDGQSAPFRIRGGRWQLAYHMSYRSSCTLLLVCFGPSAVVHNLSSGSTVQSFDLGEGDNTQTFQAGPGLYQVHVGAGQDGADWSMTVQDYY